MTDLSLAHHIGAILARSGADADPAETAEWCEALDALTAAHGPARARYLLDALLAHARRRGVHWQPSLITPYVNTIALEEQPPFPGDLAMEQRLAALMRWNALAMVMRANRAESGGSAELGGHIASYASAADLFEVGFNHFFRAADDDVPAGASRACDLVFFQPHSAPGVYARAFLEGRLTADDLGHYRRELVAPAHGARGLTSYPHPQLMPDFWQFPTGSMGIGPINAIYQARFLRYLGHRGLLKANAGPAQRRVWGFFGDGEMDEPESIAALTLAAREQLDNCTFVINCNLQRLDGPVRGNGRIVDELESVFAGAGWHVIKCLWSSDWDVLFARDTSHALMRAFAQHRRRPVPDAVGERRRVQSARSSSARTTSCGARRRPARRGHRSPCGRGGHDAVKIHAAFAAAVAHAGQPTVVLAKTMKGYAMGEAAQGRMTTHQAKKLDDAGLLAFRDRFALPMSDADTQSLAFYKPADDSAEMRYLHSRRRALGGRLPAQAQRLRAGRGAGARRDVGVRAARRRQGDEHDDGVRAHPRQSAEGPGARARASFRSSPTRRARSAWRACSARSASTRRSASSTSPRTRDRSSRTARTRAARSSRKASPRRARCRRGPRRRRRTRRTASRCCRSTSTTRCSASSASAT
jgi:pyruvate dehydrogenase E1 component